MKDGTHGGYQQVGGQQRRKTDGNQTISSSEMERISAGRRGGD